MALTKVIGAGIGSVSGVNLSSGNVTVVDGQGFYFGDGSYRIEGKDDGATTARIGFVAGGSEVARFTSSGLTFGGDTATANALNDYEEGTFTPTYTAASAPTISYNTQDGKYTKIGQTVAFNCRIATNSKSGGSGSLYIAGLPFANSKISAGAVVAHSWLGEHPMKFRIVSSGIFLYYRSSLHGDDILANTQTADMNTSGSGANLVEVTGVYFTDS